MANDNLTPGTVRTFRRAPGSESIKAPTNLNPNSPEYQRWLMQNAALGKTLIGDNRSLNPNVVLTGLARPESQGGGVWGRGVSTGSSVGSGSTAVTSPSNQMPSTPAQTPSFDMQGFLNSFRDSQNAIAEANRQAAAQQQQAFLDWQTQQSAQQAAQQAAYQKQIDEYNQRVAEQQKRQYEQQLLLNDQQVRSINDQKANIEKALRDAASQFEAGRGAVQDRTGAQLSQVLRNFEAERAAGLSNLAARNRGLDPAASGRFLNDLAAGKASALASTQSSGFDSIQKLKDALDGTQRTGLNQIADLNRLATYLGTNVANYFPGVSY